MRMVSGLLNRLGFTRRSQLPTEALFSAADPAQADSPIPMAAVACIGMTVLIFEILLTRVFSVTMWYHFAFLAISLALFGLAASGVFVAVLGPRLRHFALMSFLGWCSVCFAVTVPLSFWADQHLPFYAFPSARDAAGAALVVPYGLFILKFLILAVPFFLSGTILALLFAASPRRVHKVYFADLAGGGLGCILVVPLLLRLSAPACILLIAALPFLAAYLFFRRDGRTRLSRLAAAGFVSAAALGLFNDSLGLVRIVKVKSYDPNFTQEIERPKIYERWHPVSRVVVHDLENSATPYMWFYSGPMPRDFPRMLEVTNDGGARTFLYPKLSAERSRALFENDLSDIAYAVLRNPRVLVVGVGGGKDVLSALTFGASGVVGVEINPLMVDIVQKDFASFTGAPYGDPRLQIVIDEGRNCIASHSQRYDLIKISVTDTWAASAMGAYALTENYLYTREALKDYLDHLNPGGMVSITRWYPNESLRLLALVMDAIRASGGTAPLDRLFVARNDHTATVLVKKSAFTSEETAALIQCVQHAGHTVLIAPGWMPESKGSPEDEAHREVLRSSSPAAKDSSHGIDLNPPTDDRPFFFNLVTLNEARREHYAATGGYQLHHGRGLYLLMALLKITIVLSAGFVLAPLLFRPRQDRLPVPFSLTLVSGLFFLCLGLGFMLVEIPLMQRFILFLGHPIYALTVILFSILLFSSLGGLLSGVFIRRLRIPMAFCVAGTGLLIGLYGFALPMGLTRCIGLPIHIRILLAVVLIAPLGLGLGMPFPAGLERLHGSARPLIPWAWAINGAASVSAPVVAMVVAILKGFSWALYLGAAAYIMAAILLWILDRRIATGTSDALPV